MICGVTISLYIYLLMKTLVEMFFYICIFSYFFKFPSNILHSFASRIDSYSVTLGCTVNRQLILFLTLCSSTLRHASTPTFYQESSRFHYIWICSLTLDQQYVSLMAQIVVSLKCSSSSSLLFQCECFTPLHLIRVSDFPWTDFTQGQRLFFLVGKLSFLTILL